MSGTDTSSTDTSSTADLGELTFRRVYRAPRELIFDCMTQPGHLTHFWGPAGTSTPREKIALDLRPGGAFETVMVSADGSEYPMRAVFAAVDRPGKLAWTEREVEGGMLTTVTFTDLGDGRTEVIIHQTNVPALYRSAEAQAGFRSSLDRFDAYLGALHATR